MVTTILLDAGPLGIVTNPNRSQLTMRCAQWLQVLLSRKARIVVPEIADYEVRRELLRVNRTKGVANLDAIGRALEYLPITTETMRLAAELWARARQRGQPTADDRNIDADMILVAQSLSLRVPSTVIATTNVGHLSRFAQAEVWEKISVV